MLIAFCCLYALSFIAHTYTSVILPQNGQSVTVPLRRRSSAHAITPEALAAMADRVRQKYNISPRSLRRRQKSGVVPISDEHSDSFYSGVVSIGGQDLDVLLDTGSSDLWVASSQCTQGCTQVSGTYDSSFSSTFKSSNQPISLTYGDGSVSGGNLAGVVATDKVSMGGFSLNSQTFVVAEQVSDGLLDPTIAGLVGLGLKSIAATGATPFVEALASSNSFSLPVMSFYFERQINNENAAVKTTGGIMTLGGTNSSLFTGSIDYVNIPNTVTPGFWLLPVSGVSLQGSMIPLSSSSQVAAIDSGTTLIGGPSADVASFYSNVPGAQLGLGSLAGLYTFPCTTTLKVSFSFGGKKSWAIDPEDFTIQTQNLGEIVCYGALFDMNPNTFTIPGTPPLDQSTNPDWIVGDAFLKNVYSVFQYNPPAVGFAQLSASALAAGSQPGTTFSGISTSTASPAVASSAFSNPLPSVSGISSPSMSGAPPRQAVSLALVFGLAVIAGAFGSL